MSSVHLSVYLFMQTSSISVYSYLSGCLSLFIILFIYICCLFIYTYIQLCRLSSIYLGIFIYLSPFVSYNLFIYVLSSYIYLDCSSIYLCTVVHFSSVHLSACPKNTNVCIFIKFFVKLRFLKGNKCKMSLTSIINVSM